MKNAMQFLRRHQFLLCFMGVLVLSCVLVVRQFLANQSAHVEAREDFILLVERGQADPARHLYQVLIQELPDLSEKSLVDDLQRTSMLIDPKTPEPENLIWKYHVSLKNEITRRSEQRLARVLERAAGK
jgi:hypothetical protein